MTGKTLSELNVQPGDVVSFGNGPYTITKIDGGLFYAKDKHGAICGPLGNAQPWHLISRAYNPKLWRDMTPAEKGALLLAYHDGKVVDFWNDGEWDESSPAWHPDNAYRTRPEPKVDAVVIYGGDQPSWVNYIRDGDSHRISFNLIDGKPDCDSVKMEEL